MPNMANNLENILSGGALNLSKNAAQEADPLGSNQRTAYGGQLISLVSNPQAGYASTPLAKSENSGVADMFAAAGVSSNLTSMMQPYLKQLNALSFGDYIKDLVSVSGADSGANVAAAQYDLKQASNNEAAMANLVSPMGNMMSMLGGGGGGGGGGINTTGMNLGGTGAGIDAGGVGATGGTAELDAAAMLA